MVAATLLMTSSEIRHEFLHSLNNIDTSNSSIKNLGFSKIFVELLCNETEKCS